MYCVWLLKVIEPPYPHGLLSARVSVACRAGGPGHIHTGWIDGKDADWKGGEGHMVFTHNLPFLFVWLVATDEHSLHQDVWNQLWWRNRVSLSLLHCFLKSPSLLDVIDDTLKWVYFFNVLAPVVPPVGHCNSHTKKLTTIALHTTMTVLRVFGNTLRLVHYHSGNILFVIWALSYWIKVKFRTYFLIYNRDSTWGESPQTAALRCFTTFKPYCFLPRRGGDTKVWGQGLKETTGGMNWEGAWHLLTS